MRITINKERDKYALKRSILPKHWNESKQLAKANADNSAEINQLIELHTSIIKSFFNYMVLDNQSVTPRIIKEKIIGMKENRRTILKVFQEHNNNARKLIGIDFAPGTVQRFKASYMHTKDFIQWQLFFNEALTYSLV